MLQAVCLCGFHTGGLSCYLNVHETRKSSCVNARGIPTSVYQVLHLFPEVGYPPGPGLTWGGYPRWDTHLAGGTPPGWTWLGYHPSWTWTWPGYPPRCGQTDGWMDGQTRVKTLPSRRTTYAVGNNKEKENNIRQNSVPTVCVKIIFTTRI